MSRHSSAVPEVLRDWRRRASADPELAELVGRRPNTWAGLSQLVLQWLLIVATAAAAQLIHAWPATVLAIVFIGTRQHALLVLMHDAAHYLLVRERRLNDLMSNLSLSFPLLISTSCYRDHHMAHHRHLNTPSDPDYVDAFSPASRGELLRLLLCDVSGLSTLKSLRSVDQFGVFALWGSSAASRRAERLLFLGFCAAVALAIAASGVGQLLLTWWLAPMVFVLPLLLRVRSLGEHAGLLPEAHIRPARSIAVRPLERLLVAPCSIGRHLEHHLFPKVPNYRLERLSQRLRQLASGPPMKQTGGYAFGPASVLGELFPGNRGRS